MFKHNSPKLKLITANDRINPERQEDETNDAEEVQKTPTATQNTIFSAP